MPLVNIQDKFIIRSSAGGGGGGVAAPSPSITNTTPTGFTVSWSAVPSAIAYRLDVATDSGFTSFVSGFNDLAVAGTSQVVTGLSPETTYYVRARSVAAGSSSSSVSQQTSVQTSALGNGLLAFYKLSDETDASGNGNTLTNNNGVTFSSGKIGDAATFNGSNTLSVDSSGFPSGNSDRTIAAWFKTSNSGNYNMLFSYGAATSNQSFGLSVNNSGVLEFAAWSNDFTASNFVADGNWHHVVAINSSVNGRTLYCDGVLVASNANPINTASSGTFKIGEWTQAFGASMNGQIDAVGIWNRALNSGEIAELYNSGNGYEYSQPVNLASGLQSFYKLSDVTDSSGNGNTLTNNGGVTFSSGKIGDAAVLVGDHSKYLEVGNNLGQLTQTGFSISCWFNATAGNRYIISSGNDQQGWFLAAQASGSIYFAAGSGGWQISRDIPNSWSNGVWSHVVITSDSSGNISYYVNGQLQNVSDNGSWTPAGLRFGSAVFDSGANYEGQIDAVGIWNRALTSGEIAELYNSGNGYEVN